MIEVMRILKASGLKPGHAKLAAYFNMDNGGGAFRGVYLQATKRSRRSSRHE